MVFVVVVTAVREFHVMLTHGWDARIIAELFGAVATGVDFSLTRELVDAVA